MREYTIEDQSRNGVKVIVYKFNNGNTTVEADCNCFGYSFRLHSNQYCKILWQK